MNNGPDISRLAALIADPVRAMMLGALMDGRALTATELSRVGGITPQTASSHLAKLVDGGFLHVSKQGRHRYFRLADDRVADLLENMMRLSAFKAKPMPHTGPRDAAMRHARICYDHLAGEQGVALFKGLVANQIIETDTDNETAAITPEGESRLIAFGIDVAALKKAKRPTCRTCLDWSMRTPHLAGGLGAALWQKIADNHWARRVENSRVVTFTPDGARQFQAFIRAD